MLKPCRTPSVEVPQQYQFQGWQHLGHFQEFYDIHARIPVMFTASTIYKLEPPFLYFEALIMTEDFISNTSADLPHFMNTNTVKNQRKSEAELSSQQGTSMSLNGPMSQNPL
ncbi:hypothetical protein C8J56DRAFT_1059096 [Mycena floridula]|nr:hypothetical protein C8J56DRAFT_1059096 [Mycena floridula]